MRREWLTIKCYRYKDGPLTIKFSNMKTNETMQTGLNSDGNKNLIDMRTGRTLETGRMDSSVQKKYNTGHKCEPHI